MERINILNVGFDNITMQEAVSRCNDFLNTNRVNMISTPNPEIVMKARAEKEYNVLLNESDMVIPDGIGVIIASKILKTPLKERVAGYDLICNLFSDKNSNVEKKVYIFGAKPGVSEISKEKIEEKYGVKVVGCRNGYFNKEDEEQIVQDISNSGANILLVGLGMGKQEEFIYNYRDRLNVKIAIGCGGSIDVLAGVAQRAPDFYVKHNLEWFYRLIKQPSRIGRMMQLPKFLLIIIFKRNKKGDK